MLQGLLIFKWPYPPTQVFFAVFFLAFPIQAVLRAKNWKGRYALPCIGCIILLCGLGAAIILKPQHIFGGRFWTFFSVALPGIAALCGAAIGNVVGFLWDFLK